MSTLQKERRATEVKLPNVLAGCNCISNVGKTSNVEEITYLFPDIFDQYRVEYVEAKTTAFKPMKIGVVLSGGQAPGGHNVIAGIYDFVEKGNGILYGFLHGPKGIFNGDYKRITGDIINEYKNLGGFDMICSGRDKIETAEQFAACANVCNSLALDGLIIIGGDDSNTNAAMLAQYFKGNHVYTKVIGCPKTIDGDLKNNIIETSFGFDTATKIYSELIGNICTDALSAQKYYHFIRLMGRSASHVTLECALQVHPNITLIGEEILNAKKSVKQITDEIVQVIVKRAAAGKNYGIVLLPEGLIEFIPEMKVLISELNAILAQGSLPEKDITEKLTEDSRKLFVYLPASLRAQLTLDRDAHGNVKVSQIETEKFIIECVQKELETLKAAGTYTGTFNPLNHFFGYEGRCGMPSQFDCYYCYALGYNAAHLIQDDRTGLMSIIGNLSQGYQAWTAGGYPLTSMMAMEKRGGVMKPVIAKALVELKGAPFTFFSKNREEWTMADQYLSPGPIQYFGSSAAAITKTLELESGKQ
ncbi:hypothetical protein WA158_005425 [Blastocystis sp. Blastoise]